MWFARHFNLSKIWREPLSHLILVSLNGVIVAASKNDAGVVKDDDHNGNDAGVLIDDAVVGDDGGDLL